MVPHCHIIPLGNIYLKGTCPFLGGIGRDHPVCVDILFSPRGYYEFTKLDFILLALKDTRIVSIWAGFRTFKFPFTACSEEDHCTTLDNWFCSKPAWKIELCPSTVIFNSTFSQPSLNIVTFGHARFYCFIAILNPSNTKTLKFTVFFFSQTCWTLSFSRKLHLVYISKQQWVDTVSH